MGTAGSENGASEPVKVFLLDDHEIVRRGVRDMLEAEGDITVTGEAGTASSALARIPAHGRNPRLQLREQVVEPELGQQATASRVLHAT